MKRLLGFCAVSTVLFTSGMGAALACPAEHTCSHGKAMWGEPKYPADFTHFDYTNPDAPKGGTIRYEAIGSFDSLNSHILKGLPAQGLSMIYDTLITQSGDEPFTKYGLIAKEIQLADDGGSVSFILNEKAKWHDGQPITVEDVVFSFDTLMTKGHPYYRSYYREVEKAEGTGENRVTFTFATKTNRELPLILGQLPILPRHYYDKVDITKTTMENPLGSGPYKVETFEAGKWIKYTRVKDYWGRDLPVNKGRYNFDEIVYDYYRDATVAIEGLKAGEHDIRMENISKVWSTAYDIEQVEDGRMVKEEIAHERPTGMQGFAYNIRRSKFADMRIREALSYAFDFEWTNKNIFYNAYNRTTSYFSNSEFASKGLPKGKELELLAQYGLKDAEGNLLPQAEYDKKYASLDKEGQSKFLPSTVFYEPFTVPTTDGTGNIRDNLRAAKKLLRAAGVTIKKGQAILPDGTPFEVEFLFSSPVYERMAAPFIANLKKLGIAATIRTVDSSQYIKRVEEFDFDIMVHAIGQSLSPGNEQEDYWNSDRADISGSRNVIGIKNPVVDMLIEKIITSTNKEMLVNATRALDRVLLANHYVIPHYHTRAHRVIYWNKFSRPEIREKYLIGIDSWWFDEEKAAKLSR